MQEPATHFRTDKLGKHLGHVYDFDHPESVRDTTSPNRHRLVMECFKGGCGALWLVVIAAGRLTKRLTNPTIDQIEDQRVRPSVAMAFIFKRPRHLLEINLPFTLGWIKNVIRHVR